MTHFDHLLNLAVLRLKNSLPLPLDMEAELVSRGYDIEALRNQYDHDDMGWQFDLYGMTDPDEVGF